jgi:hypothetical protein
MKNRIGTVVGIAVAGLAAAPAAQAQNVSQYAVTSAKGVYDVSVSYPSENPNCAGVYEREEHADFKLRRSPNGQGGTLVNGVGSLVLGAGGGFDGVYRSPGCDGGPTNCEHHFGWHEDGGGLITLTFVRKNRVEATLSKINPLTDTCPLLTKNGTYLGKDSVSSRERRAKKLTLKFKQTVPEIRNGQQVGALTSTFTVKLKRSR